MGSAKTMILHFTVWLIVSKNITVLSKATEIVDDRATNNLKCMR